MDITKLRKQTAAARASKEEREEAEFMTSPLKDFFDRRIKEAANEGKSELSLNFYYTKECVLGYRYNGPTIDAVIRHYSNEGFSAWHESWLSPNGCGNTSIVISWQ